MLAKRLATAGGVMVLVAMVYTIASADCATGDEVASGCMIANGGLFSYVAENNPFVKNPLEEFFNGQP